MPLAQSSPSTPVNGFIGSFLTFDLRKDEGLSINLQQI